jgi:hypothetical protein
VDTHLINSRMLSRKDVHIRFSHADTEFSGHCLAVADNGLLFHAQMNGDADFLALPEQLQGKRLACELSSPKARGDARIQIQSADIASGSKKTLSFVATFASPPDPAFLKLLFSPVIAPKES